MLERNLITFRSSCVRSGLNYQGGPCDPTSHTNLGGVGALVAKPAANVIVSPITDQYTHATNSGRTILHAFNICPHFAGIFANCYGYTGAHSDTRAAGDSEHLFQAVAAELHSHPRGPKAIVGDVNSDLQDIPTLDGLIQNHGWIDLLCPWFTCIAHNSRIPSRRDYILVSPEMFSLIDGFQVLHHDWFPVHSMLQI